MSTWKKMEKNFNIKVKFGKLWKLYLNDFYPLLSTIKDYPKLIIKKRPINIL